MPIITVDFDGTLYQKNSILITLKAGKTIFTFKQWHCIAKDIVKGMSNKTTGFRVVFLESFFRQMKGKSLEELEGFFMALVDNGHQGINYNLIAKLNKHLENGDRVVILSGALQPFLTVFIQQLNIQADVIGTLLYFDEKGACTGKIGKINHGIEKVTRLKFWIEENNACGEAIWAYADSESDIPILEFADKAIVVRPTKAFQKVAESKGWEIFIS